MEIFKYAIFYKILSVFGILFFSTGTILSFSKNVEFWVPILFFILTIILVQNFFITFSKIIITDTKLINIKLFGKIHEIDLEEIYDIKENLFLQKYNILDSSNKTIFQIHNYLSNSWILIERIRSLLEIKRIKYTQIFHRRIGVFMIALISTLFFSSLTIFFWLKGERGYELLILVGIGFFGIYGCINEISKIEFANNSMILFYPFRTRVITHDDIHRFRLLYKDNLPSVEIELKNNKKLVLSGFKEGDLELYESFKQNLKLK